MKNSQTRIAETVRFVQRTPAPPGVDASMKGQIAGELARWSTTTPTMTRDIVSGLMSREGSAYRPNSSQGRETQRAAILIMCALVYPQTEWADKVNYLNHDNSGDPNSTYREALELAWDAINSRPEVAQANLNKLKTDPLGFLRLYKLWSDGAKISSQKMYSFYMRNGIYRFACLNPKPGALQVSAISVPATAWATVKSSTGQINATKSNLDPNCELVLTSQFSGCTYCFSIEGSNYAAAHIDPQMNPNGGPTRLKAGDAGYAVGAELSTTLKQGGFSNGNGGTFHAYGRVNVPLNNAGPATANYGYGDGSVIILAIKRNGAWNVYAQQQEKNGIDISAKHINV